MKIEKYAVLYVDHGHDDLPEENQFLVLQQNGTPMNVFFNCPCGCGSPVRLPLVTGPDHKNNEWEFKTNGHLIHPSVRHLAGCKSHYFIRLDGTIDWC